MEIRPHRRLIVPYEPPRFADLISVSESVSYMYEHVGVAKFSHEMFSFTDVSVLRRMCDSLALKLMVECGENRLAASAALAGDADFVIVKASEALHFLREKRVLVRAAVPDDVASARDVGGVACDAYLVQGVRTAFPSSVIVSSSGDPVRAVKNGADYVVVGDAVLGAESPGEAARDLAEDFREYT